MKTKENLIGGKLLVLLSIKKIFQSKCQHASIIEYRIYE